MCCYVSESTSRILLSNGVHATIRHYMASVAVRVMDTAVTLGVTLWAHRHTVDRGTVDAFEFNQGIWMVGGDAHAFGIRVLSHV